MIAIMLELRLENSNKTANTQNFQAVSSHKAKTAMKKYPIMQERINDLTGNFLASFPKIKENGKATT